MALLAAGDPLPATPGRVLLAGTSGAGKTTLGRAIAGRLGVPYVEIDALYHGPQWTKRESFLADVDAFSAEPGWVTDWQYSSARELLASRADTVVWLDHPTAVTMSRVVRRTVRRRRSGEELWNGNREGPLWTVLTDRGHIVRWAWRTRRDTARRVLALSAEHGEALTVVRLRGQRQVAHWLGGSFADALIR